MRSSMSRIAAAMVAVSALIANAAQDVPDGGKSQGPIVLLPPVAAEAGAEAPIGTLHLPGLEYRSGTDWWGLSCHTTCELRSLRLDVIARPHPQYDGDPVPGQLLQFSPAPPPGTLAIFKPFRVPSDKLSLRTGPVASWHPGLPSKLRRSALTRGTMEGEIVVPDGSLIRFVPTLVTRAAGTETADGSSPELVLDLVVDDVRQTLGTFQFGIEGPVAMKPSEYVQWIGDLDGDGKADFLVSFGFDGGTNMALFLSSLAREGELVGRAGSFVYFPIDIAGC